jgi:hypothetical protein
MTVKDAYDYILTKYQFSIGLAQLGRMLPFKPHLEQVTGPTIKAWHDDKQTHMRIKLPRGTITLRRDRP